MKTVGKIWMLIFAFSFGRDLFAQSEDLRFEHIGYDEGLSKEHVNAIMQDSKGYIWVGTFDGLNKYDGYTFTKYKFDPLDPLSVSQNFIYTIFEDNDGIIWLSTFEGLCKFDRKTELFTRYKPDPHAKFSDPNITTINQDKNGWIWVGSASGGLCRFDRKTGKFLPEYFDLGFKKKAGEESQLHDLIGCIYKDKAGDLWTGNSTGLHLINVLPTSHGEPGEVRIKDYLHNPMNPNSLSGRNVSAIFEDHRGVLWVATDNGLNSLNKGRDSFSLYQHFPGNPNSIASNKLIHWTGGFIKEDKEGNLWIGTDKGLSRLNKERNIFSTYRNKPGNVSSISVDNINSVLIDRGGTLWVGGLNAALNKANLVHKSFGLVRNVPGDRNSLSNNKVTSILEDNSGMIWVGTDGGGLDRWDRKSNLFTHYKHESNKTTTLRDDAVYGILEDRDGQLWVCNGEFLSKLNKQTNEFTHYNSNEASYKETGHREIYAVTEDRDGIIWLGTANGIKSFDKTTGRYVKHYYHDKADSLGISDYTASAIFADSKDNIWIGYGSIATDRLNRKTGIISHYKHNPYDTSSISSNIVNSFFEDSSGNLWLATSGGGLCHYNYETDKFSTYTDKHGLPDNSVYAILEGNNHHLWLSTANGISQFDPKTGKFTNYDPKDGLQGRVFAAGNRYRPARFKGKDGVLYFGGPNGFNFFHPDHIKANEELPPVVITQFKLFDSLVKGANESKEIFLRHNENYFSFEFSSLSFYNPVNNRYAYKLEGVDKDWVYCGTRRYTSYTNIDPGTYTFYVKATNGDGIWNEEAVSMIIVIHPPWWRTWWAYWIYGLILVAMALAVHRYQKQKTIRHEREKAQKRELAQAKEIEKAYRQLKETQAQLVQQEKMASLGELTAGIAHEIQNPLNFINNFSEVNKELLAEISDEIKKGNFSEVPAIAKDIIENEEKISHHGKRADAIVKGMLQHSRISSGQKLPTDINALADEYLRLAYHGLRAKDKSFNVTTRTEFDNSIDKLNVTPQDIGRVILNLINNAFYAVNEKAKQTGDGYEPTVTLVTMKKGDKVEIWVRDNGNGIPQKVLDKIFQPFFTTKPTGLGTGLGLSLSYDIVKSHGGELKVLTKEGEGADFIIQLPLSL